MTSPLSPSELEELAVAFSGWLEKELETNPAIDSVEENRQELWWYVRVEGEAKDFTSIKYCLGQRTLSYESYLMPYPQDNIGEFLELLLRLNAKMYGGAFVIGAENAIYLSGQVDARSVASDDEMDRILGSMYSWSQDHFSRLLELGYASRF